MKKLLLVLSMLLLSACVSNAEALSTDQNLEDIEQQHTDVMNSLDDSIETENVLEMPIGDNDPVSRGMAAKMLAIIFGDRIDGVVREITFEDTNSDIWYDKYINIVYIEGMMSGYGENNFMPEEPLTIGQAQSLIDKIDPNNTIRIQIPEDMASTPISFALWTELLIKTMENMSGDRSVENVFGVSERSIIPLATQSNNSALADYHMITDIGVMTHTGISMLEYLDKEIRVLVKGDEILSVIQIVDETPTIRNAYITSHENSEITIFAGGVERVFSYDESNYELVFHGEVIPETFIGLIGNVTIGNESVLELEIFSEKMTGVIKKVDWNSIELDIGLFPTDTAFKVYDINNDSPRWRIRRNLIVGTDIAEYIVHDGKILAALINNIAELENIRVAINTTGFGGLIHDAVSVTGTSDFYTVIGEDTYEYSSGEIITMDTDLFGQQRVYIYPNSQDGRITITSINRNWSNGESPQYRGIIEVAQTENGLTIVNEVNIEEYLYAVVPSEMPSSYGVEASKVQAVTARSYAYNQYFANRYHRYGANVDDSVLSQVYNNTPENEISIQAVNETAGQCLVFNNSVISANFFSTSSGRTANSGEVWVNSATNQFPAFTPTYLSSSIQYLNADFGDLSIEENAYKFFTNTDIEAYDSEFNWFRWNVEMTADELSNSINSKLKSRYDANPQLIKTLQPNGLYRSREISSIGQIVDIEVMSRGEGGNILELRVKGTEAEILILTEYNIRMLIEPTVINRIDGSILNNYSLLPSAFFVMDKIYKEDGNLERIIFYGGGNGHGVGMSQNGAKGMIDRGYSFTEILTHFYQGTEVRKMIHSSDQQD